jgi:Kef-type K+ transport system membrane component KefB
VPPDWLLAPFDVVAVAAVAWLGGTVMGWLRHPSIAGEMAAVFAAGLLLGGQIADVVPGRQAGGRIAELFPPAGVALITVVGGLGLILYMLLVGATIDPGPVRERAGTIAVLAATTTGAMGALAVVAGPLLADAGGWMPANIDRSTFVIALGAGLAASGVPIVARILEDRAMRHSPVGCIVIVAGTAVTALALLASAVAIDGGDAHAAGRGALRAGAASAALIVVVALARRWRPRITPTIGSAVVPAIALLAAMASDWLLSSLLIGPLVIGLLVRRAGPTAVVLERRLGWAVRRVGLPAFLGLAALHTDLHELRSGMLAAALLLVIAVVVIKLAIGYGVARLAGLASDDALATGALLQCGGIVTIAISLDLHEAAVIGPRMQAAFALIGLLTTVAAGPLLPRAWTSPTAPPRASSSLSARGSAPSTTT